MAKKSNRANITEDDWVGTQIDISQIKKDIEYIKQDIRAIRKLLEGNGKPGLVSRVGKLEKDVVKIFAWASGAGAIVGIAANVLLKFVGG